MHFVPIYLPHPVYVKIAFKLEIRKTFLGIYFTHFHSRSGWKHLSVFQNQIEKIWQFTPTTVHWNRYVGTLRRRNVNFNHFQSASNIIRSQSIDGRCPCPSSPELLQYTRFALSADGSYKKYCRTHRPTRTRKTHLSNAQQTSTTQAAVPTATNNPDSSGGGGGQT